MAVPRVRRAVRRPQRVVHIDQLTVRPFQRVLLSVEGCPV
jgi:hypothetical protein